MILLGLMTAGFFYASVYYTDPLDDDRDELADRFTVAGLISMVGLMIAIMLSW